MKKPHRWYRLASILIIFFFCLAARVSYLIASPLAGGVPVLPFRPGVPDCKGHRVALPPAEFQKLISGLESQAAESPASAEVHFAQGQAYLDQKKYQEGIGCFTKAIELNPNLAAAYCERGRCYGYLRQFPQAILDMTKSVEVDPAHYQGYYWRGRVHFALKEYGQAVQDFEKASQINREDVCVQMELGTTLRVMGRNDEALQHYNQAISIDPSFDLPYANRAKLYFSMGQYEPALADQNRLISLRPGNALARDYFFRAYIHFKLRRYSEGTGDFLKGFFSGKRK